MTTCPECTSLMTATTNRRANCQRVDYRCMTCGYTDFDFTHIVTMSSGVTARQVGIRRASHTKSARKPRCQRRQQRRKKMVAAMQKHGLI